MNVLSWYAGGPLQHVPTLHHTQIQHTTPCVLLRNWLLRPWNVRCQSSSRLQLLPVAWPWPLTLVENRGGGGARCRLMRFGGCMNWRSSSGTSGPALASQCSSNCPYLQEH